MEAVVAPMLARLQRMVPPRNLSYRLYRHSHGPVMHNFELLSSM